MSFTILSRALRWSRMKNTTTASIARSAMYFKDLQSVDDIIQALIPEDWLRQEFIKQLSDEDKAKIQSLGGLDKA